MIAALLNWPFWDTQAFANWTASIKQRGMRSALGLAGLSGLPVLVSPSKHPPHSHHRDLLKS